MSNQSDRTATVPNRDSRRAGTIRILANALLVLVAFEIASLVVGLGLMIARDTPAPLPLFQLLPLVAVIVLARWVFVLPVVLLVLVVIEFVARRAPYARFLTAIVAFVPMVLWELTQSSGDTSGQGLVLGVTAVLFVVLARLPARQAERGEAAQPRAANALAPR